MKIDGGCNCGHISYETEIDTDRIVVCHCTDCQTLFGAPFRTIAFSAVDGFKLFSGELKIYVKTAESGSNPFAPNAARRSMRLRTRRGRGITVSALVQSTCATSLCRNSRRGRARPSIGCQGWKASTSWNNSRLSRQLNSGRYSAGAAACACASRLLAPRVNMARPAKAMAVAIQTQKLCRSPSNM